MKPNFRYTGNINLYNRPRVINSDGSVSTVRSMSYNRNGKEYLIPTVSDEGKIMSEEEAIRYWEDKGQYLGIYDTVEEADKAARYIHNQQENLINERGHNKMEQEFDLSKAVSGQAKAMADRDFYMSMVAQNTPGASPLAAYLAGMASAKASQYEGQIQADKDARDAASKALKRQDTLRDNFYQIMGDVSTGKMQPSAGAMMLAPLAREMGLRMVEYDADGGVATFADAEGEEYEVTMDQVPDKYKIISQEGQTKREEIKAQSRKEIEEIKAQSRKEIEEIKSGSKKESSETKAANAEKIAQIKAESAAEVARINAQARIDAANASASGGGSRSANATTNLTAWAREFEATPVIDPISYPTSDLLAAKESIKSAPEQWRKENGSRLEAKIDRVLAQRGVEETTVFD